ncbi:glycosyltransferase family 1 protein [Limnohabitans sp. 2KL-51]|uniref:glycosyltransferase family 4 protein n=1 Tax=Limnohabitans sp. 2KL-51 TaxID=1977911 RepID=UPI000D35207A|nr:glycosyltransferase family 1 protein [Limnohabitans sp. 2KL-51]PUE49946.1 glycoside hydrolase [Limnohabitans sp. 2KL-51]
MQEQDNAIYCVENFVPANAPLRIAVVTETWPPEVNGVALTLSRLIQELSQRQHTIQLLRPRQDRHETESHREGWSELLLKGMPIPRYPQLKLGFPSKKSLVQAWSLQRPDLVHIATEGPLGWSALQAARVLRLPVTSDFRTNFQSYSKHYGVGWLQKPIVAYLRKFHNRTLCTMVPTQAMHDQLKILGFHNLQVVARGVDTKLFTPDKRSSSLRDQWHADDQTLVILSVGRLAAEKNLDLTVKTYQAMKQNNRPVKLVFCGDGPYRAKLQAECPDAIFMGMATQAQLAVAYASADLFMFPSLTETFGNVTLEALASGTPVLAFDCAAAKEVIDDGHNGWLVPGEDAQRFVLRALAITQKASTLHEVQLNAAASIRKWEWSSIATEVENMFRRVLTGALAER